MKLPISCVVEGSSLVCMLTTIGCVDLHTLCNATEVEAVVEVNKINKIQWEMKN